MNVGWAKRRNKRAFTPVFAGYAPRAHASFAAIAPPVDYAPPIQNNSGLPQGPAECSRL
jgi:hypothetical protein